MNGDWEEVKKPVKKAKPQQEQIAQVQRGGKRGKMLIAGAVTQPRSNVSAATSNSDF